MPSHTHNYYNYSQTGTPSLIYRITDYALLSNSAQLQHYEIIPPLSTSDLNACYDNCATFCLALLYALQKVVLFTLIIINLSKGMIKVKLESLIVHR